MGRDDVCESSPECAMLWALRAKRVKPFGPTWSSRNIFLTQRTVAVRSIPHHQFWLQTTRGANEERQLCGAAAEKAGLTSVELPLESHTAFLYRCFATFAK